jgi:hypothetical protein
MHYIFVIKTPKKVAPIPRKTLNPIRKHPVMFTKKVPKGKADGKLFCIKRDAKNLDTLPRNPPVPINSNVLIITS